MKIEIEYEEVENLRHRITRLEKNERDLEEKLKALDEKELKKEAVRLAWLLFNSYVSAIFKKLGFDNDSEGIECHDDLQHWLGKKWYDSERLTFNIGARISQKWRTAFLALGISTKQEDE